MRKTVLLMTATLSFGGAERVVVDTAKALAARGRYRPVICSLLDVGELRDEVRASGIAYCSPGITDIRRVLANLAAVRRLIRRERPDIIHTHQGAAEFYGSVAAFGLGVPVISHIQNPDTPQPFSRKIARVIASAFFIDTFVAAIEEKAENLKRMLPMTANKVHILHNAVDPAHVALPSDFDRAAYRMARGVPAGAFVVGSVGRLYWEKGYDLLLPAFAAIQEKVPNAFLVLVGAGPEEAALKALAARLGIADAVLFAGYRADTAVWMSLFDIFVVSSKLEAFPLVSLEAMYLGLPVIITDRLSSRDILAPATLVVPCSEEGLRDGILALATDDARRRETARKGKAITDERFLIGTYTEKLETIYDSVLARQ